MKKRLLTYARSGGPKRPSRWSDRTYWCSNQGTWTAPYEICSNFLFIQIFCFCSSHQTFKHLVQPFLRLSLNVNWILEGVEKLLDYGEYYCGLKYVSLYVGALSLCAIRIVWIYSGWPHLPWLRWWTEHAPFFSTCSGGNKETCAQAITNAHTHKHILAEQAYACHVLRLHGS